MPKQPEYTLRLHAHDTHYYPMQYPSGKLSFNAYVDLDDNLITHTNLLDLFDMWAEWRRTALIRVAVDKLEIVRVIDSPSFEVVTLS